MGRPSKLAEPQKAEIIRRLAEGESYRSVAKDFGVGEATLRRNFSAQVPKVQSLAGQIVEAEGQILALPVSAQQATHAFAAHLRAINDAVARAVRAGADTAALLHGQAHERAKQAVKETPDEKGHVVDQAVRDDVTDLQIMANRALSPAIRLIAATHGKAEEAPEVPASTEDLYDQLIG